MIEYFDNSDFVNGLHGNSGEENNSTFTVGMVLIGIGSIVSMIYLFSKINGLRKKLEIVETNADHEKETFSKA